MILNHITSIKDFFKFALAVIVCGVLFIPSISIGSVGYEAQPNTIGTPIWGDPAQYPVVASSILMQAPAHGSNYKTFDPVPFRGTIQVDVGPIPSGEAFTGCKIDLGIIPTGTGLGAAYNYQEATYIANRGQENGIFFRQYLGSDPWGAGDYYRYTCSFNTNFRVSEDVLQGSAQASVGARWISSTGYEFAAGYVDPWPNSAQLIGYEHINITRTKVIVPTEKMDGFRGSNQLSPDFSIPNQAVSSFSYLQWYNYATSPQMIGYFKSQNLTKGTPTVIYPDKTVSFLKRYGNFDNPGDGHPDFRTQDQYFMPPWIQQAIPIPTSGTYTAQFCIKNYPGVVGEKCFNSQSSASFFPDFWTQGILLNGGLSTGQQVRFTTFFKNYGSFSSEQPVLFRFRMKKGASYCDASCGFPISNHTVSPLASGASSPNIQSGPWTVPADVFTGAYTLEACADPDDTIVESLDPLRTPGDLNCNLLSIVFPDLSTIAVSPGDIVAGQSSLVQGVVRNNGSGGASFNARLKVINAASTTVVQTLGSGDIGLGAGGQYTFNWTTVNVPNAYENYRFEVCADPSNTVNELDESNNCLTQRKVSLSNISSLTLTPNPNRLTAPGTTTVQVSMNYIGNSNDLITYYFWWNCGNQGTSTSTSGSGLQRRCGSLNDTSVQPGQCLNSANGRMCRSVPLSGNSFSFPWGYTQSGNYRMIMIATRGTSPNQQSTRPTVRVDPPLTVSCAPDSPTKPIGQPVTWIPNPSGGAGPPYTYLWSAVATSTPALNGTTTAQPQVRYLNGGQKDASVRVTSSGTSITQACTPVTINTELQNPIFKEVNP